MTTPWTKRVSTSTGRLRVCASRRGLCAVLLGTSFESVWIWTAIYRLSDARRMAVAVDNETAPDSSPSVPLFAAPRCHWFQDYPDPWYIKKLAVNVA